MEDVNLLAMTSMAQKFNTKVGSQTILGIEVPIAAVALGAVVEKHFTLDRNLKGQTMM